MGDGLFSSNSVKLIIHFQIRVLKEYPKLLYLASKAVNFKLSYTVRKVCSPTQHPVTVYELDEEHIGEQRLVLYCSLTSLQIQTDVSQAQVKDFLSFMCKQIKKENTNSCGNYPEENFQISPI